MKINIITIGLLGLVSVTAAQPSDRLELIDIFDIEFVSDPQISPDGEKILYVRNFKDIMTDRNLSNLWIVNFDGTENRPVTTGNQNDFYPRWSHDGKKIIYKSNKDGSAQLYLRWMDTGAETKLTNVQYPPGEISWSSDDHQLAFNMFVSKQGSSVIKLPPKPKNAKWNDPPVYIDKLTFRTNQQGYLQDGYQQLFILSADGGTPRQITSGDHNHGAPVWSKGNDRLYFSANLHKESEYNTRNTEIYRINLQDMKVDTLTDRFGPDYNPVISSDGKQIAFLGFDDTFEGYQVSELYVMDTDGNNIRMISGSFDRDVQNIQWDDKGEGLYFQYDDRGNTKIAFMNLSGKVKDITANVGGMSLGRPYSGGSFTVHPEGRYAFTLTSPGHPADLASGENSSITRITRLNDDLFRYKKLGEVEEIWYSSSYDERDIQGWIVKPPDFEPGKKYPLILEIHGGPYSNYGSRFSAEVQLYAANGYVVLYTNPRGSTSYGKAFGSLIDHNYPSEDYDDLMSGVDAVLEKGYVDENNLFVTGGSGGGVLSAWIIGKTDRFNAAVIAKPVINWYSMLLYSDLASGYKYWFSDYPWNMPEAYLKYSPISLVGNVSTPAMVLTGEQDFRTPIADSEQYYTALKLRKIDAALVRIPNSTHEIAARPSNLIAKVSAVLTWFNKYKE